MSTKKTYIEEVHDLKNAFPALEDFLRRVEHGEDEGGRLVVQEYEKRHRRLPGHCALLTFDEKEVKHQEFVTPDSLEKHFRDVDTNGPSDECRLYILEDIELKWINTIGGHLKVDPLVFGEQMNTWNYTDSGSIPVRIIPSMVNPSTSFNLRYYEFRQLHENDDVQVFTNQMTFAANRRLYETWVDMKNKDFSTHWRHGLVRRCASFWTSQQEGRTGCNAVMLVDPPFNAIEFLGGTPTSDSLACAILKDPTHYPNYQQLWKARDWVKAGSVEQTRDYSKPYHGGSRTLTAACPGTRNVIYADNKRNLTSPLDKIVFHWQKVADQAQIKSARDQSVNSAHYLLKYLATMWTNQLDIILCGVAQSEYFADDHEASIDFEGSSGDWKKTIREITDTTSDINYMRRQMGHFQRAMTMNLERLGLNIGLIAVDSSAPQAIQDAQKDFISINAKLKPYCDRIDGLTGVAQDLANLHSTFQSIKGSELGLRLSVFALIVFPMTLVAGLLSMGDEYLPGKKRFWVYWAVTLPLIFVLCASWIWRGPEKLIALAVRSQLNAVAMGAKALKTKVTAVSQRTGTGHRRDTARTQEKQLV